MKESEKLLQMKTLISVIFDNVKGFDEDFSTNTPTKDDDYRPDYLVNLRIKGENYPLIIEEKDSLQPRQLHGVAMQLKQYGTSREGTLCVLAPYISEKTAELCKHYGLSYMDFSGNCMVSLPNVHIEKAGRGKEESEKRELSSIFGEKSSRILSVMLNEQAKAWQVKELSVKAQVSLGQVSNVRRRLLDLEYAGEQQLSKDKAKGVKLTQPSVLLHDWQKVYKKKTLVSQGYFSLLDGEGRDKAIRKAFKESNKLGAKISLSGFSAARWIAPFAKSTIESFYADEEGQRILINCLELQTVEKGANIFIEQPKDNYLFRQVKEVADGILCTSLIQTYLDLSVAGERGREAAEHLESLKFHELWRYGNAGTN